MNSAHFSKNIEQAAAACERYEAFISRQYGGALPEQYERKNLLMDLTAADGVNGNLPIDWAKLMAFDDFNFMHDLAGIAEHLNRSTGKLEDFFLPRAVTLPPEA